MTSEVAFVITLLLALLAGATFFWNRVYGIAALLAFRIFIDSMSRYGTGIVGASAPGVFGLFLILIALVLVVFEKSFRVRIPILLAFMFFFCASLPSLYNTSDILGFWIQAAKYAATGAAFVLAFNVIKSIQDGLVLLRSMVLVATITTFISAYQLITGNGLWEEIRYSAHFYKVVGTYSHPNQYAFFLGLSILIGLLLVTIDAPYRRWYLAALVALTVTLTFTYSRSAWLAVAGCALILGLVVGKARVPIFVLMTLVFVSLAPYIATRFEDIINPPDIGQSSLEFRIEASKQLLEKAHPVHPVLGFGMGSIDAVMVRYTGYPTIAHNDYMKVLIEGGIVASLGLALFVVVTLVSLLIKVRKLGNDPVFTCLTVISVYFFGLLIGTNTLGNLTTHGVWMAVHACLLRMIEISESTEARKSLSGFHFVGNEHRRATLL